MKMTLWNLHFASPRLAKAIVSSIIAVLVLIHAIAGHAQQSLSISAPADGAVALDGQSLNISVSSSGGAFSSVQVIGENIGLSLVSLAAPYTFSLTIPSNTVGLKRITAAGVTAAGIIVFSPSITVDCEPSATVTGLTAGSGQLSFNFPGQQVNLSIQGTLSDASVVDLTRSSRTSYSSGNTSIATVDANGVVTAVGPGTTTVSIANGGQSAAVSITVPSSLRGDLNADGKVDTDDLNVILAALNTNATGSFDARDLNGDGVIDMKDGQALASLCTLASCSTSTSSSAVPSLVLSPIALAMGGQTVGSSSASQLVTVVNSGTAALTIQNIAAAGNFTQTNTCSGAIAPETSCAINIVFKPASFGISSGTLTITDNAAGSPHILGLSGIGTQAQIGFGVPSIPFPGQLVGTTSAAQTLVVSDTGNADLTISSTAISGTNGGDFTIASGGTCPTSGGALAAGTTCSVNLTFKPTALGARSGTLTFTDNASNSPQTVALSGTGTLAPSVTITPSLSSITVLQALTVTVGVSGGTGNPTPSGSVTLSSGTYASLATTLSSGSATINVPAGALAVGSDTLTAAYAPDAASSATYSNTSNTTSVTVSKLTPTVTVTPSQSSITTAQALSVTVAVGGGTGNPASTGSVTLTSGSYTSAATTLSSGSATINIPAGSLATGTDTLTANYTGDGTYVAKSGTNTVTVTVPPTPSFTVTGTAVTVSRGATTGNTSTITVTPSGGFTGSVALTAALTSSPTGAQYLPTLSFGSTTPVSIISATAGTATLTIATTPASSGSLSYPQLPGVPWYATGGATLACLLLIGIPARRRTWRRILGMLTLLFALIGGASACGGKSSGSGGSTSNPGTTAGTYTVTVTGVSGSLTQTGTLVVTVN